MSANKPPNNENLDESFDEDFDFGEGQTETRPAPGRSSASYKKVLVLLFLIIVSVVLFLGYRRYGSQIEANTSASGPSLQNPSAAPVALAHTPSSAASASPAPLKPKASTPEAQNFAEMAAAFAETNTPEPAAVPPPATAPVAPLTSSPAAVSTPAASALLPPIPSHPAQPPAEPTAAILPRVAELTQGLNKLNDQIDSILNQIKYLDSYSREVSENLNKLNEAITAMDSRLSALTNTTSTLSKDVGSVRNEVGQVRQVLKEDGLDLNQNFSSENAADIPYGRSSGSRNAKVVIEQPEYTVHAVIPGRAWLKSARGQIITVTEGESIGNYGKVLVIDAANAVVLTSSGVSFR